MKMSKMKKKIGTLLRHLLDFLPTVQLRKNKQGVMQINSEKLTNEGTKYLG